MVYVKKSSENAITTVHRLLRDVIRQGDVVIDATVGNGWDTAVLAQCVGADGYVYGFDIQQIALAQAREHIPTSCRNVRLICADHAHMREQIETQHHGCIRAVTFNLGYLPGGDKRITTTTSTTLAALDQALDLVMPGGLVTIVCYRHPEGAAELTALRDRLATLPQERYTCVQTEFFNQRGNPPIVFAVYVGIE